MEMGLWVNWDALLGVRGRVDRDQPIAWYFVVPNVANVRRGPGTDFAVTGQLRRSAKVSVDGFTKGEKLYGTDQWAHLSAENASRDVGFVHSRLLRKG